MTVRLEVRIEWGEKVFSEGIIPAATPLMVHVKPGLATTDPESVGICNFNKFVSLIGTTILIHQLQTVSPEKACGLQLKFVHL